MKTQYARPLFLLALLMAQPALQAQNAPQTAPAAGAEVNPLTQSALQQGMFNCVGRINQVGNFLGYGSQAGALLMAPAGQADQRLISYSMEMPTDKSPAYIAAYFAPNQATDCSAVYEAVVYWPQGCEALARKEFAALKPMGPLKSAITVLEGGAATKVFLMPAGSGCLSIKKEMVL